VLGTLLYGFVATTAQRLSRLSIASDAADDRPAPGVTGLFTTFALDLAGQRPGRTLAILQAGCTTAGPELDLAGLRSRGLELDVTMVDDLTTASRSALAARPELAAATLGELRLLPIRPRSADIVQCSLLLHRISDAETVLSKLAAAVRPGGLLLLRLSDPGSAMGFLDRRLPRLLRAAARRRARPGQAGPYPARFEAVASARGIETFANRHGLSIAHRGTASSPRSLTRPALARAAARLLAWLSRGRLAVGHDELFYVIRRPVDRFARVLP
jgi:SAM-dependent methyltransferase